MTLLASQIPVLYCMLYYRAGGPHSYASSHRSVPLRHFADLVSQNMTTTHAMFNHFRRSSEERSWTYHKKRDINKLCSGFNEQNVRPADVGQKSPTLCSRTLPDMFMSENDLRSLLPQVDERSAAVQHHSLRRPVSRYVANSQKQASLKANFHGEGHCGTCLTEVAYEVVTEIVDFKGDNHTVINFNNAYQFIPTGRCLNENSPCGGGAHAKCRQMYRAHWTLVWASSQGVELVAHEVPSHCECLNIGSSELTRETPPVSFVKVSPTKVTPATGSLGLQDQKMGL